MQGIDNLRRLPDEVKGQIAARYGSIEEFYKLLFELNARDYKAFIEKKPGYKAVQQEIETQINDIEEWLEGFGVDGRDVTSEISSDHGEIIVNKHVTALDNYLKQYNTDFATVRKWLKDKFGV